MPPGIVDPHFLAGLARICPGCRSEPLEGARWGALLTPPVAPLPANGGEEFRLVLFGSFWIGHTALKAVLAYLRRFPGRVRLVGVVTDDPVSPQARISLKKRAWGLMSEEERLRVKLALLGTALAEGVPAYTGEIKTPGFRRVLGEWAPDAIITCGFGQVLDRPILDAVAQGAYNCHPTDLLHGHGAGPSPWADMTARGVHHTVWSVHQMTEIVDAGPVIGQTPPINVGDAMGRLPDDHRSFFHKVLPPIGWMVLRVLDALIRRQALGLPGPLRRIDLDAAMPAALRQRLLLPIAPDWPDTPIPVPEEAVFAALRAEAVMLPEAAGVGS